MSTRYTTIKTELVDPELETKIDVETQLEPVTAEVPDNLYAAIINQPIEPSSNIDITVQASPFSYSVPNRVYTLIVPEKPPVLAAERIFVYVPKVTRETAGIAKFDTNQFNVVDGEISIKGSYLDQVILSQTLQPSILKIVTTLPLIGSANLIYLVPVNETTCASYIWDDSSVQWLSLGTLALNLSNYYTKIQIDDLLASLTSRLSDYYTKIQIDALVGNVSIDLSNYYTKSEINTIVNNIPAATAGTAGIYVFENSETAEAADLPDNSYAFIKT